MRRVLAIAVALLMLTGCASTERPEGIVERWLLALNQGEAGQPGRYAEADVTDVVRRAARIDDAGDLDRIEVGRRRPCTLRGPVACESMVPFRIDPVDGSGSIRLLAILHKQDEDPRGPLIVGGVAGPGGTVAALPSQGGAPISAATWWAWLMALSASVALILLAEGAMRLARGSRG